MTELAHPTPQTSDKALLAKALINAGKALGLTQTEVAAIVGRNRTSVARDGIDPASKAGELALLLIRVYRSVYTLTGGDSKAMAHWFQSPNRYFGAVPRELVHSTEGLVRLVHYLDAMRGRI